MQSANLYFIFVPAQNTKANTMGQLMQDQGLDGVAVNETLEKEINKRYAEIDVMHESSDWTKAMEQREEQLETEIKDLQDAYIAWRLSDD